MDPRALVDAADGALYESKRGGRNQVTAAAGPAEPTARHLTTARRLTPATSTDKQHAMNVLRRLLLGSGRFPDELRTSLRAEGVEVLEEGLSGSVTFRNYRARTRHYSLRKVAVNGAIALTTRRIVVWYGHDTEVDIPVDHALLGAVSATLDKPERIRLSYSAQAFHRDRSGTVELRFTTSRAAWLVERLTALGARTE